MNLDPNIEIYVKEQIQRGAAELAQTVHMSADEYIRRVRDEIPVDDVTHPHAVQLGAVTAMVDSLLYWLKRIGLYTPEQEQQGE